MFMGICKDRSMAATVFGGKNNYDFWDMVFENGRTPDGTQVMTSGLNVVNMIKNRNNKR